MSKPKRPPQVGTIGSTIADKLHMTTKNRLS
jgi:hypothetical protein